MYRLPNCQPPSVLWQSTIIRCAAAPRTSKTASGDGAVRAALKSGKVKVLVLAQDAAPNSKKEIYFLAEMAGVQVIELLTRNELGYAIGKGPRIAVAITDANFANMLLKK